MTGLLALLWIAWPAPPAAAEPPRAVMVVARGDAAAEALGRQLEKDLQDKVDFRRVGYSADDLGNPIYKGKLLATLSASRLVVSVGDEATRLVLEEVENIPVYFVGASVAPGSELSLPQVAGTLSYSPEDILSAVPKSWKGGLGLLYTPGYEPVVEAIRGKAEAAGIKLIARRVVRPTDLPPAARALMGAAKAVWVLGDPMLDRGAGFDFLAEESLTEGVPLIGAGPWEVSHGAAFCSEAAGASLAAQASKGISSLLEAGRARPRLSTAPEGGRIVYHRGLAARYGLSPQAPVWVEAK